MAAMAAFARPRPLKIGTDCSGMETPVMALKKLKVPYKHCFSCDIDKNVKTQILENFPPEVWYDDLMRRDNSLVATPGVDVYVAGFPCQPFSAAGLGKGFKDKRGNVFFGCCDYIESKRPRVFILENVKRLLSHDKRQTFKRVMDELEGIGNGAYDVQYQLLNSQEHGVPQSRPRIYIVGIRKDCKVCDFEFPEPLPRVPLDDFLDPVTRVPTVADLPDGANMTAIRNVREVVQRLIQEGAAPLDNTYVIDCEASQGYLSVMKNRTPCMTKSRSSGYWITSRGRRMNVSEMLRCQGMERSFKQVVSDRALGQQIGNAMGQNILERLFVRLLPAAGLVSSAAGLTDRWAASAEKAEPIIEAIEAAEKATEESEEARRDAPTPVKSIGGWQKMRVRMPPAPASSEEPAKKRVRMALAPSARSGRRAVAQKAKGEEASAAAPALSLEEKRVRNTLKKKAWRESRTEAQTADRLARKRVRAKEARARMKAEKQADVRASGWLGALGICLNVV